MMKDKDPTRARRVAKAMLQMVKLETERLERAYVEGRPHRRESPAKTLDHRAFSQLQVASFMLFTSSGE